MRIYLDNNATTQVAPSVYQAFTDCLQNTFANPSSVHQPGQKARHELIKAREFIASVLKVAPQEIVFTATATEAANLLLRGFFGFSPRGHVISSNLEHSAVFATLKELETAGVEVSFLEGGLHGAVTCEQVEKALRPDTRLITLMACNNETGVLTDIEAIADLAASRKIPFIVDGVALLGKERFKLHRGISAMFFSGHKFHAPKGVAFMVVKKELKLTCLITGGDQEGGRRGGTENLAGIVALAEAVRLSESSLETVSTQMRELRDYFEKKLQSQLPFVTVNGRGVRVCNTSSLSFGTLDGEALLMYLDLHGVAVSHGSACASGALEPSRVLLNMGLSREQAASSLRFSLSRYTTKAEIDRSVELIVSWAKI